MITPRRPKLARTILASATGLALAVTMSVPSLATPPVIDPPPGGDATSLGGLASKDLKSLKVAGSLKKAQGDVSVFVQFEGEGAFAATQPAAAAAPGSALVKDTAKVKKIRDGIKAKGKTVAKEADARVIYTTTNAIPGVALHGDADALRALAARSDVKKITAIVPKTPDNKNSDIDTKAIEAWSALKQTGKGVKIAVLDTGIDYTHAGFGGPGTLEAYKKAQSSTALPSKDSGLYDPDKFIGGWDLVGDDYNADPRAGNELPARSQARCQPAGLLLGRTRIARFGFRSRIRRQSRRQHLRRGLHQAHRQGSLGHAHRPGQRARGSRWSASASLAAKAPPT